MCDLKKIKKKERERGKGRGFWVIYVRIRRTRSVRGSDEELICRTSFYTSEGERAAVGVGESCCSERKI